MGPGTTPQGSGKLIGQIDLRNPHRIYQQGDSYAVVGESPNGQRYERRVSGEATRYLADRLRSRWVTAGQAAEVLEPVAARFALAYTYGHQLTYSAQDVLLVLVALGLASVEKEGRSFVYHIQA